MTRSRLTAIVLIAGAAVVVVGGVTGEAQASHPRYIRSYYYDYCAPTYYYPAPVVYYRPAPVYYSYSYPAYPVYSYRPYYYSRPGIGFSFYFGGHRHYRHYR